MKRTLVCLAVVLTVLFATAPSASAVGTSSRSGTISGPTTWCQDTTTSATKIGFYRVSFGSVVNDRRSTHVRLLMIGLEKNTSYNVYINERNIQGGKLVGCMAAPIGEFTTSPHERGVGIFSGSGSVWNGTSSAQVLICPTFLDINISCFLGAAPMYSSAPFNTPTS